MVMRGLAIWAATATLADLMAWLQMVISLGTSSSPASG